MTIPKGAELVNANGGVVNGDKVTWKVTNLPAGQGGKYTIEVKWPQLADFAGQFIVNANGSQAVKAKSAVKIKVFSDRFEHLQHQRYILGYPDGTFKT